MEVLEYDLTTEERADYLFARVHAVRMTSDVAKRALRETRNALMQAGTGRLLLEYELAHTLSDSETVAVMRDVLEIMPGMRIAFLDADSRHMDSLHLATSVGVQAGEEHHYFSDPRAAEKWLLEA